METGTGVAEITGIVRVTGACLGHIVTGRRDTGSHIREADTTGAEVDGVDKQ